jgi:hypothetical protein
LSLMFWVIGAVLLLCTVRIKQIQRAWDLRQRFTADVQINHGGELDFILHLLIT